LGRCVKKKGIAFDCLLGKTRAKSKKVYQGSRAISQKSALAKNIKPQPEKRPRPSSPWGFLEERRETSPYQHLTQETCDTLSKGGLRFVIKANPLKKVRGVRAPVLTTKIGRAKKTGEPQKKPGGGTESSSTEKSIGEMGDEKAASWKREKKLSRSSREKGKKEVRPLEMGPIKGNEDVRPKKKPRREVVRGALHQGGGKGLRIQTKKDRYLGQKTANKQNEGKGNVKRLSLKRKKK